MNRIILIGNGFDLAHDLKTGYEDFIKWYWTKRVYGFRGLLSNISDDGLCSFKINNESIYWSVWAYSCISSYSKIDGKAIVEEIRKNTNSFSMEFTPMFHEICLNIEAKGWVDIEEIYYKHLKRHDSIPRPAKDVNKELDIVKSNLIEYLSEIQKEITDSIVIPSIKWKILSPISPDDIAIGSMDQWKDMMKERLDYNDDQWEHLFAAYNAILGGSSYSTNSIKSFKHEFEVAIRYGDFRDEYIGKSCPAYRLPDKIMLLNFNYTNTADIYLQTNDLFSVNHIHGSLSNPQSVIFGYGDEHDDEYQPLMKKNNNEYLRHIKSFRYLESSNYRKMLGFIELGPYQVCIMGLSCGISDRTLLKTLFEHKNCVSIKPYYYRDKDGKDNYFDLICNIARNISDPRLMRDRVVRKERCQPLG